MAINVKGRVKVLDGKAYRHPMTIPELEFLLSVLADAKYKLKDVPRILDITQKLQSEYKLLKEHSKE